MKKSIIILVGLFAFALLSTNVIAVTVNPGVYYKQGNGNAIYSVNQTMQFNQIVITIDNVTFNSTVFNCTSAGGEVNVTFSQFVNNATYEFTINNTGAITWFNISGIAASVQYSVYHNGTFNESSMTDTNGDISFNTSAGWNGTILLQVPVTSLSISGRTSVTDVLGIANSVITILGTILIIGAIMTIVGLIYTRW